MYFCLYLCTHVHMYTCTHVRMCACMHVCMYACMHVCMPACLPVCLSACLSVCLSVYDIPTYLPTYIDACMHTCMHAHSHTSIHPWIHTCTHAYIHNLIHPHIHPSMRTCIQSHPETTKSYSGLSANRRWPKTTIFMEKIVLLHTISFSSHHRFSHLEMLVFVKMFKTPIENIVTFFLYFDSVCVSANAYLLACLVSP